MLHTSASIGGETERLTGSQKAGTGTDKEAEHDRNRQVRSHLQAPPNNQCRRDGDPTHQLCSSYHDFPHPA